MRRPVKAATGHPPSTIAISLQGELVEAVGVGVEGGFAGLDGLGEGGDFGVEGEDAANSASQWARRKGSSKRGWEVMRRVADVGFSPLPEGDGGGCRREGKSVMEIVPH